jgi:RNA polymerase sigma-70 factor, ECF subfamily
LSGPVAAADRSDLCPSEAWIDAHCRVLEHPVPQRDAGGAWRVGKGGWNFLHPSVAPRDSGRVQGLRTIDEQDVIRLVREHQTEVWRYLRYLGATAELADDLTQETFLQLLRAPYEDRGPAARAAWLRTVARNLFVKSFRRPPFAHAELDLLEAAWTGFAGEDEGQESLARLRSCLERLDGRAREVVRMHYEERRSRREIALRMSLGEDGVKSLLRRTRAVLRACIERYAEGA